MKNQPCMALAKQPDLVTHDYIEATRLGVTIRTPIENVAFFRCEDKQVVAYTKTNGQFVLNLPLWKIEVILAPRFLRVERSHLVQLAVMRGRNNWRKGNTLEFEVFTHISQGGRLGLLATTIPVSRALTKKVKACL